jgi:hypothetical protein
MHYVVAMYSSHYKDFLNIVLASLKLKDNVYAEYKQLDSKP